MDNSWQPQTCPQCGGNLPQSDLDQITCPFCSTWLMRQRAPGAEPARYVQGVRLVRHAVLDQAATGMEAAALLVPAGWRVEGGLQWRAGSPGMPAVLHLRISSPSGLEAFELLPTHGFFWSDNPLFRMSLAPGSNYLGNEVRSPLRALEALQQVIIPRYRNWAGQVRVSQARPMPELVAALRAITPTGARPAEADGAGLRLHYTYSGREFDEDLTGVVEVTRMGGLGFGDQILWSLDYLVATRAPAGQLDKLGTLYRTMLSSFALNLAWFNAYLQISQQMINGQIQNNQQVMQLSRHISQNANQISDMVRSSYENRQHAMDRISHQFSQATRGVQDYYDPARGGNVELPGGYSHAWANGSGEYIVTDAALFDPNTVSNQNWRPIERA